MMDKLKIVYMTLLSLFTSRCNDDKKRLYKKKEPKKMNIKINNTQILVILVVILLFILSAYLIYRTGSLESTGYYYRLNG